MSAWDDTRAPAGGEAWNRDGAVESGNGFNGGFSDENISKHAYRNGDGTGDGGCRICGAESHFARDCPNKKPNSGECYNCGETGHNKADCSNPTVEREFTGACNHCGRSGHRARDCPEKPAETCRMCKEEGHIASECTINRMTVNYKELKIETMSDERAWKMVEAADNDKDVDDIKKAILTYAKAFPEVTFQELEKTFRDADMNTYLIAKQQEVSDTHTIVNLQGKQDQEYVISVQFSDKPRRPKFAEGWPSSPEENMDRLAAAGIPMDRMVPKCSNCRHIGHTTKACPEGRAEKEQVVIMCANCNEEGHRIRDCPQPRKAGTRGCKNCGQEGHIAKECSKPPNSANVECRNCGTVGHFARDCPDREPETCRNCGEEGHRANECDKERVVKCKNCDASGHMARECPEPRNMAKVQCHNCLEFGHTSRDCPKPTDWSRVECSKCNQKGHSYKRCKEPAAEARGARGANGDGGWSEYNTSDGGGGGDWDDGAATNVDAGAWGGDTAAAATTGGGW